MLDLMLNNALSFVETTAHHFALSKGESSRKELINHSGKGNDFLGWMGLPDQMLNGELKRIQEATAAFREMDALVVIGIGGSYLGTRAIHQAMSPYFGKMKGPELIFAGYNTSEQYHAELLSHLEGKEFGVIVVSKSGTTTEPALAFRFLLNELKKRHGAAVKDYVIAITDGNKGALRKLSDEMGFQSFVIADDVGGRFSVFSPVGIVPLSCYDLNLEQLIQGAYKLEQHSLKREGAENICVQYAAIRNLLYNQGKYIELLVTYEEKLHFLQEWWKQLFGESEGKEGKGIFPASAMFTTDLHSLGQQIQDGERNLFETVINFKKDPALLSISEQENDDDQLNYLNGKNLHFVTQKAREGTMQAHLEGGVPVINLEINELNEECLGALLYFFEFSCAISAYSLGVNPFDQPGVELYKKNMFRLLGKPGFKAPA